MSAEKKETVSKRKPPARKKFVLGIDVGGTSIKPALFELRHGEIAEEPSWQPDQDPSTQLGLTAHASQMADIIADDCEQAQQLGGTVIAAGIGSPGRFRPDGTIKPETNIGKTLNEFDNVNLRDAYTAALQETHPDYADLPLTIGNDANAMLAGMIDDIVHSSRADKRTALHDQDGNEIKPSTLLNRRVAMFGIGTGLGHAIVDVSKKGNMKFVTDGHASRIRLTVDTEDLPLLQKAIQIMNTGAKPEIITLPDNSVRAEDLMRAPVLRALAGVESAKEIDWTNNPEHDEVVRFVGKYMGRLISVIKSGHSEDVHPENGWSEEEKQQAAGTQYYLLGGGIGSKPLGAQILRYAEEELDRLGIKDIKLVQYTRENPAPRAAAMMVPTSLYSGIERAV